MSENIINETVTEVTETPEVKKEETKSKGGEMKFFRNCSASLKRFSILLFVIKGGIIVNETKNIHSVSLTGGEPLTETDFLIEFLPLLHKKIYLETNGTLPQNLNKIINFIDIISMDIKLNSTTKSGDFFIVHEKFIEIAINAKKEIFLKTVFDENITDEEINKTVELANKYNIELILQPKMNGYFLSLTTSKINEIYEKFNNICKKTRLIPQTHKFLNIQ